MSGLRRFAIGLVAGAALIGWAMALATVVHGTRLAPVWLDIAVRAASVAPAALTVIAVTYVRLRRPGARLTRTQASITAALALTLPLPWVHGGLFAAVVTAVALLGTMAYAFAPRRNDHRAAVAIDATGVHRTLPSGGCEEVRWEHLIEVQLRTTSDGPRAADVYWLLRGTDGGVAVPADDAPELLPRLQRLPAFDNAAVIAAMGCTHATMQPCWTGAAGAAEVCRAAPVSGPATRAAPRRGG